MTGGAPVYVSIFIGSLKGCIPLYAVRPFVCTSFKFL